MPHVDLDDDVVDLTLDEFQKENKFIGLTLENFENPDINWLTDHNGDVDGVFEDTFAAREPHAATTTTSHDAPKMWTKFGEMEEAEEEEELMDLPQQVDLSPSSPIQSPPDYVPSPEHLVADKYPEMPELPASCVVEAVDLDLELGDAGAGASAEIVEQEDVALEETLDVPVSANMSVEFPESLLLVPRSYYEPFEPGVPVLKEREAVARLLEVAEEAGQGIDHDDFVEFQLDDFSVYSDRQKYGQEMCSLHHLHTKHGFNTVFFDGKLSVGNTAFYVHRVEISALPIENYGTLSKHTVKDKIWVRSVLNTEREIYYRLNSPAKEYRRFFDPFLWVADLAKHFVDYLKFKGEEDDQVTIFHFRSNFSIWLAKRHRHAPDFISWKGQHVNDDFRTAIVANIAFLHKEAIGVLGHRKTYKHVIWAEVWEFTRYKPCPKIGPSEDTDTVVTQYIFDCFSHQPFGNRLKAIPLSETTQSLQNALIKQRHLELPAPVHDSGKTITTAGIKQIRAIRAGDTISTQRDAEGSGTQWRRDVAHGFDDVDRWFALVQRVRVNKRGQRTFDVIWYYRPVDTLCGLMKAKISEDEVSGVHQVEFGGTSATEAEFFCRQTYICQERNWVTLEKAHFRCIHLRESSPQALGLQTGETRLIMINRTSGRSEPCEFLTFYEEEGNGIYRFRKLLRRYQVDPASKARPNELVYSYVEPLVEVKRSRILEPCFVRHFKDGQAIPTPYDRDGVGGFFYFTHEQVSDNETGTKLYVALSEPPSSIQQGYDPSQSIPRLRGLDLFCGGGNFGRGLEDGGAIEMRWANDFDAKAIHTYMANITGPSEVSPFLGSIDDLQRLAIEGEFSVNVPPIGDVDFISGGSPCPGFSRLTNDKTTAAQRKNQSLVAAFASCVDLYRPRYGLLENVPGIVQKTANRDQDVFSQLICAIVGLGYQAHFFFLDASACGAPQRRSRVFLAFAAPGHRLPHAPYQTHGHPQDTSRLSLGILPTGEPTAERAMPAATPFDFVSARASTADLPPIYDSKPDVCVPYPDHRVSVGITPLMRGRIHLIPTQPWGMNFAQAWYGRNLKKAGSGVMTPSERLAFPERTDKGLGRGNPSSNAYGRQRPDHLFVTVVKTQSPDDAKNGRTLHWHEPRVLSIMEARRAQGFRDEEVLLGIPSDQYKIVGNSVAREVAVSLGAVFCEAWIQSLADEHHSSTAAVPSAVPARIGIEVSPITNIRRLESESASIENTPQSSKSRSESRVNQVSSTPSSTPPAPPQTSTKRSRIAVEIHGSKFLRTDEYNSPSKATSVASSRSKSNRLRHSSAGE
ncbi:related to cytosine C5-DNA-methyltransferase [Fusarium fujikuroi IMI 58289]|uniref:DNA (cytosine-5-)-methyltransferase n=1 Tax=Gibberella fujikuroi (strain CBS 195.34 / IMI 58289 / NRRL A-6831) TaxID=1279085 RepID=S0EAD4_GIBF5|nr:related to cytosine C5-DNA-methyltransferase [Fusarium fujikuroi IMI 58289]CCT71876.1 related to cytosine C5-DNA-methyltransferase [Fusarium fujikuroi IMI 58289]SCO19935.1 related to cytosine C5-DNA-methyltransferase [Fusarium fujikuroi]